MSFTSSASVGYFIAWLILALHREAIQFRPPVQRRIKYTLGLLLIVDALAGIGIYAAAKRDITNSLGLTGNLPLCFGPLTLFAVPLCVLEKSQVTSRLLKHATSLVLGGVFLAYWPVFILMVLPAALFGFSTPSLILLIIFGIATVWSWILATRPIYSEILYLPSKYVFRLFLIFDATVVFLLANLTLLVWVGSD